MRRRCDEPDVRQQPSELVLPVDEIEQLDVTETDPANGLEGRAQILREAVSDAVQLQRDLHPDHATAASKLPGASSDVAQGVRTIRASQHRAGPGAQSGRTSISAGSMRSTSQPSAKAARSSA